MQKNAKTMESAMFDAVVTAPFFSLGIRCAGDDWVDLIEFLPPTPARRATSPLAAEAARQVRIFLDEPEFVFGLPLKPAGTVFQRRVWQQIADIPVGRTRTYGELATAIGSAPRAVGQACGANPYPLVVPCHRVVAANGGLGGFNRQGGGLLLDIKRWLLAREER